MTSLFFSRTAQCVSRRISLEIYRRNIMQSTWYSSMIEIISVIVICWNVQAKHTPPRNCSSSWCTCRSWHSFWLKTEKLLIGMQLFAFNVLAEKKAFMMKWCTDFADHTNIQKHTEWNREGCMKHCRRGMWRHENAQKAQIKAVLTSLFSCSWEAYFDCEKASRHRGAQHSNINGVKCNSNALKFHGCR